MYGAKQALCCSQSWYVLLGVPTLNRGSRLSRVVSNVSAANSLQPTITSPCGVLYLREPVVNLTGSFSAPVKKGSYVYLYIAPNVTVGTVLKVIQDCTPIKKEAVDKDGQFLAHVFACGKLHCFDTLQAPSRTPQAIQSSRIPEVRPWK